MGALAALRAAVASTPSTTHGSAAITSTLYMSRSAWASRYFGFGTLRGTHST